MVLKRNDIPPRHIPGYHFHSLLRSEAASDSEYDTGQDRKGTQHRGLLQKAGPYLARRSTDTGKNPELAHPGIHGNRKGIMNDQNQGNRNQRYYKKIKGQ